MSSENPQPESEPIAQTPSKVLTAAAQRALAEAAERRAKAEVDALEAEAEEGGPSGPEPTRFGDWERKGIAVDF